MAGAGQEVDDVSKQSGEMDTAKFIKKGPNSLKKNLFTFDCNFLFFLPIFCGISKLPHKLEI